MSAATKRAQIWSKTRQFRNIHHGAAPNTALDDLTAFC